MRTTFRSVWLAAIGCALLTGCGGLFCDASNGCGDSVAAPSPTPSFDASPPAAHDSYATRMQEQETDVWELGDSVTRGEGSTGTVGYRRAFYDWTQKNGYSVRFKGTLSGPGDWPDPAHDGKTGNTIGQISDLVRRNYAASYGRIQHVDLILLLVGTDDLTDDSYSATDTVKAYGELLEELAAVDERTTFAVSAVTPHEDPKVQARIDAFNARLPEVWNRYDAGHPTPLLRADLAGALGSRWTKDLFYDAVHPNDAGYDRLDTAWLAALTASR